MNNISKNKLIAFIIGSSWLAFFLWFIGFNSYVGKFNPENTVSQYGFDPYFLYTLAAPLYIGFMSFLAVWISDYFEISIETAFLIVGVISPTFVYLLIQKFSIYNFTEKRYRQQYLRLLMYHFLLYNVLIVNVYKLVKH